jgi:hypothetical protein
MNFAVDGRGRVERHVIYRNLRHFLLSSEQWLGRRFGLPVREKPYTAWFDLEHARQEAPSTFDRRPGDYVVLNSELNSTRISNLMSPDSGYGLARVFHYMDPLGLGPDVPFVNPPVYVFQRLVWE